MGIINRTFTYKIKDIMLPIYKSMIRPNLVLHLNAWNPWVRKDIDKPGKVQRRFTCMIPELRI